MNTPRNLSAMSFRDLSELERKVAAEMVKRYEATAAGIARREADLQAKQAELRTKLARMATDLNIHTEKVFGKPAVDVSEIAAHPANGNDHTKKRRKGKKVPVQYRDPTNPANTWTGRGKPAAWLAAQLKAGRTLDEFRISK